MGRIYELCYTKKDGERITGQLYTAAHLSKAVTDREEWGCKDIVIKEYKPIVIKEYKPKGREN